MSCRRGRPTSARRRPRGRPPSSSACSAQTLGDLAPGASATVTLTIIPHASGTFGDAASLILNQDDVNLANNTAGVVTAVAPAPTPPARVVPTTPGPVRLRHRGPGSALALRFSAPLDPASASDLNHFALGLRRGSVFSSVKIRQVAYDSADSTVTVITRASLDRSRTYVLTLSGLADASGIALSGPPESFVVGRRSVAAGLR